MAPTANPSGDAGAAAKPKLDELETALAAAAQAGKQAYDGDEIAADDAGASKLSLEVDREGKLPKGAPPGEGDD